MDKDTTIPAISNQYQRTLRMFREAVNAFPADEWRYVGENGYPRPAAIAYHTLEAIDFYTSGKIGDEFPWGLRFDVEWETKDYERLPSHQQLLTYLDEIETKITKWFNQMDISAPEETYSWTGDTKLENAIYLLRHTHQHTAELSLELHHRGYQAPEWR
jgi:hypothetical protein